MQLSRSLEGQPSGSFRFITERSNESDVRSTFRNDTAIEIYGHAYAVGQVKITRLSTHKYKGAWIEVEVSLRGRWEKKLKTPVKLRDRFSFPRCGYDLSIAELADRLSVPYRGDEITIRVPRDTPIDASTSLGNELGRARSVQGFTYYSNPNAIEIRKWGQTKLHQLSPADLLSDIAIGLPGQGNLFNDVQLVEEFKNTRLDFDPYDAQYREEDVKETVIENALAYLPPEGLDSTAQGNIFRSGSGAFDSGGTTRSRKTVTRFNGQTLTEIETTYGLYYYTDDMYDVILDSGTGAYQAKFVGGNSYNYWSVISEVTTDYQYDRSSGYLLRVTKTGWRYGRFKQESNTETIDLQVLLANGMAGSTLTVDQATAELNAYRYQKLPVFEETEYTLESMLKYYPDIRPPLDTSEWVEPQFVTRSIKREITVSIAPNPRSTATKPLPPLIAGRDFREEHDYRILYPPAGIKLSDWKQSYERYRDYSSIQNREGANIGNSLAIDDWSDIDGRPGIHTRLQYRSRDTCAIQIKRPSSPVTPRYLLNTPNSGKAQTDVEEGSIGFQGVRELDLAIAAAETEISIRNAGAESWQIVVPPNLNIDEGDRISLMGREFVVLSVSENLKIEGSVNGRPSVISEGQSLTIGRLLSIPVSYYEVLVDQTAGAQTAG